MRKTEVMKKALSILLAFCMVLSCVPTTAFAVTTDNLCEHHEVHTAEVCGYVEGEADCTYHCEVCHVQELVDTLPESVTAENSEAVAAQLTAIDTEKASLSDEEMTQVDFAKYTAAAEALGSVYDAVPADTGYYAGGIVGSQEGAEITNASNSGIVNGGDTTGDTTEAIQIFIKKPDGTTLTLEVAPDATVNSIKETIQEKYGYPTANQTLIYNGQQLIDGSKTLTDYSITSGATIQLMVRWNVTIAGTTNGTVTADKATATEGATVTLTIVPNEGYELDALTVTYGDDNTAVIVAEDNTFTMPAGDVTVTATFKAKAPELVETNTIYFDNSVALWSTVYAYAWESETGTRCLGTWPGTVMTLVEGETSIYSVAVPAGADTIIFNNGSEQTGDQPLGTGNCFKAEETNADGKYIGSWYTYPCTHADGSYTDNLDGTHSGTCTACGSILAENEVHTLDETGKCVCGLQAVAKVGDTFYLTLKDALTAVESSTSVDTVVTLLADVTGSYYVESGTFTLDLNGKTITANDMNALEICNADTNIIIIDGAGGGTINGGELSQGTAAIAVRVYGGAKLTIRGGTFTGTYGVRVGVTGISGAASVVIEDGTFLASDAALYVENSQDSAIVQGGSFIGDDCAIVNWGTLTVTGAPILTIKNGYAPIRYCGGSLDLSSAKCGGWIIANSSGNDLTVEEELLIPEGHDVYEPGTTNQLTAIGAYGMGEISDHVHVDHEEDGDHICDVSGCGNVSSGHTYDSDGKCTECGEPAAMLLTFADDSTLYTSDVESLMGDTDDKSQNDITCIQLLRDVNLKDGLLVFSTVLDLNDFALTGVGVASMGDLTITGPGSITGGMAAVGAAGKLTILGSPTLTAAGMEGVPYATIGYCGSQIDLSKCTGYNGWTVINLDMNEDQMPVSNILLSAHGSVEDAQGNLLTAGAAVEYEGIVTLRESTCTALGHKDENWKDPTCTEWGSYDDVAYCSECEAEVSRTTVPIPATGHDWDEPAYQWNAAYTTCTATRVCENDETHVESVIATTIESNMTVAATCTDEGQMTYTATFAEDWAPEVIEYDSIPVIAHSEEYDYTNNGDGTHDVNYLCHVGVKEANVPHTYIEGRCVCGIQVAALTAYDIIKGDGGKWTKGSSYGLSFTANGPFSKFVGIEVDGKEVSSTYYTAESGSTIITLKQSFLKRLSTGEHTITVLYTDGETSGTFKILAQSTSPATGDDSNIMLWSGMLCVSTLGLVVLLADRKRRRSTK